MAGPAALVFGLGLLLRLLTAPTAVDSLDALFFVRGLVRYSVLELRPHWPGYPVYLAAARVVRWMLGDAETSLRLVSMLASSAAAWPIMALVHDWRLAVGATREAARLGSVLAGLLWILAPLSWLVGTEIGSDPLGLLVALLALLLCTRALPDSAADRALLGAAVLAGLLLGIRLPYAALLLPVVEALRQRIASSSRTGSSRRLLLACVLAAAVPVATWLGWQISADGAGYLEMARSRLAAHYGNWTERVLAHGHWHSRPATLVRVLVVDGLGGWWTGLPLGRVAVTMGWLALTVAGVRRLSGHALARRALLLWTVPYLAMILLFNDVALSRYALPLLAALCLVAGMGAPARPPAALGTTVALTVALGAISVPLAWEHRHSPLPAVQWVRYVKERYDPRRSAMVVTDHVPMVSLLAEDYAPDFPQSLVSLGEMSAVVASFEGQGRRVYATAPDPTAPQDWTPVACFARNPRLQSRGPWELWLYEHGGDPPARRPVCHTR